MLIKRTTNDIVPFPSHPVRPSFFTISATPLPVHPNTNVTGTCVAHEIRPPPRVFYWIVGDSRIEAKTVNTSSDAMITYGTVSHAVAADDHGRNLTCVLVMKNGLILRRSVRIDIIGTDQHMGMCNLNQNVSKLYSLTRTSYACITLILAWHRSIGDMVLPWRNVFLSVISRNLLTIMKLKRCIYNSIPDEIVAIIIPVVVGVIFFVLGLSIGILLRRKRNMSGAGNSI